MKFLIICLLLVTKCIANDLTLISHAFSGNSHTPLSEIKREKSGLTFTFENGAQGWEGEYTDYPVGEDGFYELAWGWENLPTPIGTLKKGLFLNGNNHSDDLFMFVKHRIDGLEPNTSYNVGFTVIIESNVPEQAIGIGGSPGESLFFKVGGSTIEPQAISCDGFYYLNVDKGNQSQGGTNALVIGNLANPLVDSETPTFQPKTLTSSEPIPITTDASGGLWIFLGTDSGFEGLTRFYIALVDIQLDHQQ